MELRHLRYFVAVAEELNFSRAAARLHIAQPPLSQQIRALEEELGVPLFERLARRIRLTPAGEALLDEARALLAGSEKARLTAQRVHRGELGILEIGFLTSTTTPRLSGIVRAFRRTHPGVALGLHDLSEVEILRRLRERRLHAGFMRCFAGDAELGMEPVWREPLNIALPREHPLASRRLVRLADLAQEPFVMLDDACFPLGNSCLRVLCQSAGFQPRVVQFTRDMQSLIWLVASGIGCAFAGDALRDFQRDGMVYRRLTPRIEAEMRLYWRTDAHSPALAAFCQTVRAARSGAGRARATGTAKETAGRSR